MPDNEKDLGKNETRQVGNAAPQPTIPEQYRGLPGDVVEKMLGQSGVSSSETAHQAWEQRKTEILGEIRHQENQREARKAAHFTERYQEMTPDDQQRFPEHQRSAQLQITEAIQGNTDLPDLSVEEQLLIDKLRDQYQKFKAEHPDRPFQFQFSRQIDQKVFDNLVYRLAFDSHISSGKIRDQQAANDIRDQLGLPDQLVQNAPLEADEHKETEEYKEADEYLSIPTVAEEYKKLVAAIDRIKASGDAQGAKGAQTVGIREMLVRRADWPNVKDRYLDQSNTEKERARYSKIRSDLERQARSKGMKIDSNPGWFGISTRPEAEGKIPGNNQKRYISLERSDWTLFQNLGELAADLRQIAEDIDDNIKVKIPLNYTGFAAETDNIVIHFKKPESADKIDQAVSAFLQSHNVVESERNLGRAKFAADTESTSFSDQIANDVYDEAMRNVDTKSSDKLARQIIASAIQKSRG